MINIAIPLLLALASDPQPCAALGDGVYACPNADSLLVPATLDEEITIYVRTDAQSADGWICDGEWCEFDYGLVVTEDDVPVPGEGPQCDEQAQDTCEPPPSKPIKPPTTVIIRPGPMPL